MCPRGLRIAHGTDPAMGNDPRIRGSIAAANVVVHPPPLRPAMYTSRYPLALAKFTVSTAGSTK